MSEEKIIETLKYISQFVENRHDEGLGDYLHIVIGRTDIDVIDETICLLERKQKKIERYKKEIKTQQKEIEALEIIHTTYKEMIEENNYISKDKIKEKIEHYNNELEHIKNGEEFENEKPMYYWGKVALEELLEEK